MDNLEFILSTLLVIAITLAGVALYFLPSIIADKRGHPNNKAIFVLNLFFGWTFIGWVGSLIWAYTNTSTQTVKTIVKGNKYDDLTKLQKLKESGAISESEYEIEKNKVLKE